MRAYKEEMMHLYCLGKVPWQDSQLCYHALAHLRREALVLVSPATPYVCIGYHQELQQEVDLGFCAAHRIPVFRREVGGGAVYLDGNQLFFQVILRRDSPRAPLKREAFYRKFLQPAIDVYRRIGISAEYRFINDVVTGTKKISGTGAGEIGDCIVFVGNLILDFDYTTMSRVLKVPDEKFRHRVQKTVEANLTTIRRELGEVDATTPSESQLNKLLVEEFDKIVGPLEPRDMDVALRSKMDELGAIMMTDAWNQRRGRAADGPNIKIRSGLNLFRRMHKAPGGLIRADFEIRDGAYRNVSLSGDWFCYPREAVQNLESRIAGVSIDNLEPALEGFYHEHDIETPGITIQDWLSLLTVRVE